MPTKPIRNDDDLKKILRRLEGIFQAEEGTPQAEEREMLVTLVEAYENEHYDLGQPPGNSLDAAWSKVEASDLREEDAPTP